MFTPTEGGKLKEEAGLGGGVLRLESSCSYLDHYVKGVLFEEEEKKKKKEKM